MTDSGWTIYTAPADRVDAALLRALLAEQRRDRLFMESTALELKRERTHHNVLNAVAAMANTVGGVILLGVDEAKPIFDESPGVSADDLTAVLSQCQQVLDPAVTPEVIPVAIPGKDRVILVIRVPAEPHLWPVVKNGQVFLRNPGQTVAATHDQILDLVRRRDAPSQGLPMYAVTSIHSPRYREESERSKAGDLVIRLASAVYARPGLRRAITLGTAERAAIWAALGSSTWVRLLERNAPRGAPRHRNELLPIVDARSSSLYEAHLDVPDGTGRHRLAIRVQVNGQQVSFAADFHARLGPGSEEEPRGPHFGRSELALILICGLETVSLSLIPALVTLSGAAPVQVDDVYGWIESPRGQGLETAIDKQRATGPLNGVQQLWSFTVPQLTSVEQASTLIRDSLETLYVELGFDDELATVSADLAWALQDRERFE